MNKIEMSLDDIINYNRSRNRKSPAGDRGSRRDRSNGKVSPNRRHGGFKKSSRQSGEGVLKGRGSGGIQKSKFSRSNINKAQNHKLYDEPKPNASVSKGRRSGSTKKTILSNGNVSTTPKLSIKDATKTAGSDLKGRDSTGIQKAKFSGGNISSARKYNIIKTSDSIKLLVSNLDYSTSDSDLRELFTELGPMKKSAIHYDRSGRSLGTADLIYKRKSDALKAIKRYNGVTLDGRTMKIQCITKTNNLINRARSDRSREQKRSSQIGDRRRAAGDSVKQRRPHNSSRSRRHDVGHKSKKTTIKAEELDAQLDAYMSACGKV